MNETFLIILIAAAAAGIIYLWWAGEKKRRDALDGLATRMGLAFDPNPDRHLHRTYGHSVFQKGHSRQATNNIYGLLPLAGYLIQVRMADYKYVTGHGKNSQTHRISFAAFHLPWMGTPDLLVRKEHIGDKLLSGIGFDDIDFESEEFSRTFWVKSKNKKYAYDVIHPKMMEFLLRGPTPHIEIAHDVCLVQEGLGRWDPDTFEGAPGWFQAFLERWPDHLIDRMKPR
jgi:hypothetical protein